MRALGRAAFFSLTVFSFFVPSLADYINGQLFTLGLSIIDAPAPNSPAHAGSNLNIAVDVSGDGQLPLAASVPNSGRSTSYTSLNIFLVSPQLNLTVVSNSSFLSGEPTSTVKHLNWPIPQCVPQGNYNLTFYETSTFNQQEVFTITPLLVQIENPNPSGQCDSAELNVLQPQPQPSNPLPESPFAPDPLFTLTLTLSDGILNLPTVTVTSLGTPTTVVVVSESTVTETEQGVVTTYTEIATMTTVVVMPTNAQDNTGGGFLPVNSGSQLSPSALGLGSSAILLLCRIYGLL